MGGIPSVLIGSALLLLSIFFYRFQKQSWRTAVLMGSVIWGAVIMLLTEALSLFHQLTFLGVALSWLSIDALLLLANLRVQPRTQEFNKPGLQIPTSIRFMLGGIVLVTVTIGFIAIVAPPNNWDSMTYHMSRVVHWVQNRSVENYPTSNPRQLFLAPGSEFIILHLQILSGGDYLANLVQWFSMIGSTIGVSLIAQNLGAGLVGQVFAAVSVVTIPMGILQASSTQNDYVEGFWLVCLVYFVLRLVKGELGWLTVAAAGTSLGLAILTKGTGYIFALSFCLWPFPTAIQVFRWGIWKALLVAVCPALILNLGYYLRNFALYGSPVTDAGYSLTNEVFTPAAILSNIVRNIFLQITVPIPQVNSYLVQSIHFIHSVIGIGVVDLRTTLFPHLALGNPMDNYIALHEDRAANLIHFLLILFCIVLHISSRDLRQNRQLNLYVICIFISAFSLSLMLKWSPWNGRYALPLFILFSAYIGVVISHIWSGKIINFIAIILLTASLPFVFYNSTRPLNLQQNILQNSRLENYFFYNRSKDFQAYLGAANFLKQKKCFDVGLYIGGDTWEYPFWVMISPPDKQIRRIRHISSTNFQDLDPPCAIIVYDLKVPDAFSTQTVSYKLDWSSQGETDVLRVFTRHFS